jgi:predicted transcriptional regulator
MEQKTVKNQKVKSPSKKELLFAIHEATGKSLKELDSLGRSNKETIEWVATLIS